ncbi:DUF1642 domain-containing protein [Enterococcus faecalis]|uniref:DUF1642 domain-containing protein n=1 Tax=Enterococcus faecalis TaxID=1351 RepID=UPI002DB61801|nr:DUF1642 domain-containing protein [Enterococcus faecalis]MEB7790330.1 DUF1642 domain-containing protein [Enterococcus faecalis]MEB7808483.1 DUF1642 domain-containing protein [Enterococcus faecalis]
MSELTELQKISALATDLMNKKMNDTDRFVHLSHIQELVKELSEQKKVVVPKFVADELEKLADKYLTLRDVYTGDVHWLNNGTVYLEGKELELANWVNKNETTFESAWIHGYEVEKEQLYYVLLPEIGEHESRYFLDQDGELSVDNQLCEYYKLTEQEIKAIDERYWPFAVKVVE